MEKVHGDHKNNKAVAVDPDLVVAEAEAVEEAVAAVAAEEAETTKTLLLN